MSDPIEVAKAALCEVGLPEIAALVERNSGGVPTIRNDRGLTQEFEWVDSVSCSVCEADLEARNNAATAEDPPPG